MKRTLTCLISASVAIGSCGGSNTSENNGKPDADTPAERVERIAEAVDSWASSTTLDEARMHAETAANLVVGPGGLGYGDRDGNGTVDGEATNGLLPGPNGSPNGLVLDQFGQAECVERDVLGGSWDNPAERWALLDGAITEWSTTNNPFPTLPSHPMRIVGWATLTQTGTFDDAIEFSSHADLHVDVSRDAIATC